MKHIRMFENADQAAAVLAELQYPTISAIRGESGIALKPGIPAPDPKSIPFYIDVRGTVTLKATSGLQISTDRKNWTDIVAGDLPVGKTYFRVASDQTSALKPKLTENDSSDYDIGGNINSLVKMDFVNDTNCYSCRQLFSYKTKLKSASNLILPATTLTGTCYQEMFIGCTSLTTAPALPATTLATYCYLTMFKNCTSLAAAPELPATTLAEQCYKEMFYGCTSLTTAPALPAIELAKSCYGWMFRGCTALTTAPELQATSLAQGCYSGMFLNCTNLTTAPELPATTLVNGCYESMFQGCTSLTTAPELPATTLVDYCYGYMFQNCTNLNYIKCPATNIGATSPLDKWVSNVSPTGTFVKNKSTTWPTGDNGIPSGWTQQNA